MSVPSKPSTQPDVVVRTRRAYFDCAFGQLHVRTAFPATGGFDEQVTLICIHPSSGVSRMFNRFLPAIADRRSVCAPDMPGYGESDPPPTVGVEASAAAILDLAADLRLRQIDVLGFRDACLVAVELAIAKPELVRRLVLAAPPAIERSPLVRQPCLALVFAAAASAVGKAASKLPPNTQIIDATAHGEDPFDTAPRALARLCADYLDRKRP